MSSSRHSGVITVRHGLGLPCCWAWRCSRRASGAISSDPPG